MFGCYAVHGNAIPRPRQTPLASSAASLGASVAAAPKLVVLPVGDSCFYLMASRESSELD